MAGSSGLVRPRSSGTGRSGIDPGADELPQLLLRARCGLTPFAGVPAPRDEVICCEVLVQEVKATAAVPLRILQLLAYLAGAFSLPSHFRRGYVPPGVSGYAFVGGPFLESVVTIRMTCLTEAGRTKDGRLMGMKVIALCRTVARWVAPSGLSSNAATRAVNCASSASSASGRAPPPHDGGDMRLQSS